MNEIQALHKEVNETRQAIDKLGSRILTLELSEKEMRFEARLTGLIALAALVGLIVSLFR